MTNHKSSDLSDGALHPQVILEEQSPRLRWTWPDHWRHA